MRHAREEDLGGVNAILQYLRAQSLLVEKKPGVFYRRSRAFLHFHADDSGLYADVRLVDQFDRYRVQTAKERAAFLKLVSRSLRAP